MLPRFKKILVLLCLLLLSFNSARAGWYNASWGYRVKITTDATKINSDLTNFPIYVNLANLPAGFFTNVKSDGSDIRVTKSDGTTEVAREVVAISTGGSTGELHFVANGTLSSSTNTDFYIYYGNASASEPAEGDTYGKNNVWSQFVAVWHFNDSVASASTVYDSTGNSNDGTTQGSMTAGDSVTGKLGNAFDFDGSDDYVSISDSASLNLGSSVTMSAWLYAPDATPATRGAIFHKADANSSNNYEYNFNIETDGRVRYWNSTTGTTIQPMIYSNTATSNSTWHHIASVYNNSNYLIYLDKTAGTSGSASGSIYNGTYELSLAGRPPSGFKFAGRLDEMRIATTARSSAWITAEYNNQNSPSTFYTVGSQQSKDETAPSVSSLSPADEATDVAVNSNLVITFDETVYVGTGNVTIKKSSDDSTVEAIDVTGGQVTGSGSTTITINPSSDLANNTSYYVHIASTAFQDLIGNAYAGIADKTTWNFTTVAAASTGWFLNGWSKRVQLTVNSAQVNGNLTNFPVYVDMSDLPADFFNNVRSDGGDIRVTTNNGKPCALEVVNISNGTSNGEMHFKAPYLSGSSDTDFWVYYGNANGRMLNGAHEYGSQSVWSNGYAAVYHMQEDPSETGALIFDSTSNRNHANPSGSMTSGDSVLGTLGNGKALDFDGTDDYLNAGSDSSLDLSTFSVSSWIKLDQVSHQAVTYQITKNNGSSSGWGFGILGNYGSSCSGNDGSVYLHSFTTAVTACSSGSFLSTGTWYHTYATHTPSTTKLYIDNVKTHDSSHSITENASADLNIGRRSDTGFYIDGLMDEVRISNKVRLAAWIDTEYNNQSSPSTFYTVAGSAETNTDDSNPKVTSFYPADASSHFPLRENLLITFSESVTADSGNIIIYDASDDSADFTIACTSTTISSNLVSINPSSDLVAGKTYYVQIPTTCFKDGSSNYYSGIENNYTWRFTVQGSTGPHPIFFDGMI